MSHLSRFKHKNLYKTLYQDFIIVLCNIITKAMLKIYSVPVSNLGFFYPTSEYKLM